MKSNPSLIVAGAVGLAAVAGVSYGVMNRASDRPVSDTAEVRVTPQTPAVQPSVTPAAPSPVGIAPASAPAAEVRSPDPIVPQTAPQAAPQAANTVGSRKVEFCTVTMATVDDPNPPLNVRSIPSTAGTIVGQLRNGLMVSVTAEQEGWLKISEPAGWISKQRTQSGCNQKVERVSFGTGGSSSTVSDRFIGTGSHRYLFNAGKGQTMTVRRNDGPFPTLRSPDGKVLVDSMRDEKRPQWSGTLAQTGDYTVEVESNFRGYPYSFNVEIK